MKYEVIVAPAAEADILSAFAYIEARSPMNAERWLRGLYSAVHRLETFPFRFGRAREADVIGEDLRQLIFESHRIVYRVNREKNTVEVIRVMHAARDASGREDTEEPEDQDD